MQIEFEYTRELGEGQSPMVLHMMDNTLKVFFLDTSGVVNHIQTTPAYGLYDELEFIDKGRACVDAAVSHPTLKKMAHYGGYGFWSAGDSHRFVMYMLPTDISRTLEMGSITYAKDSAVSQLALQLKNAGQSLVAGRKSIVAPGVMLEVEVIYGGTQRLALGRFYIDRTSVSYPDGGVSITARNSIGKLLKEQTFNENNVFDGATLQENLAAVLGVAGVESFFVADPAKAWKLEFLSDMDCLDGISQVLKLLPGWQIAENTDGSVGIGPVTDIRFEQRGVYAFERGHSCFSYSAEFDDSQTFGKVCVTCQDPPQSVWRDIPLHRWWIAPANKSMFVKVPDGTSAMEINALIDELEQALNASGIQESFVGVFTPQLMIGDTVELVEAGDESGELGVATGVRHVFGSGGFYTEFTVDSGGIRGKPLIKDLLGQITGTDKPTGVVIS